MLDRLRPEENGGKLTVPVAAVVPPELMGAGAGLTSEGGAICIQSMDANALARHGLDKLRLGDIVAVTDYDSSYGHGYKKGGVSLGVVSSTDSIRAGYGPGVTLLMTAPGGEIDPMVVEGMNLAGLLEIARRMAGRRSRVNDRPAATLPSPRYCHGARPQRSGGRVDRRHGASARRQRRAARSTSPDRETPASPPPSRRPRRTRSTGGRRTTPPGPA